MGYLHETEQTCDICCGQLHRVCCLHSCSFYLTICLHCDPLQQVARVMREHHDECACHECHTA